MDTKLTTTEMKVLEILWGKNIAMSVQDLATIMPDVTLTTLHRIMNSLESKELIRVSNIRKISTAYARVFEPIYTSKEFIAMQVKDKIRRYKIPMQDFISALISDDITDETISELENMISDEKQKEDHK